MGVSNLVQFHDTTMRDGVQSLWAMGLRHGAQDPLLSELDQGGMINVELNMPHPSLLQECCSLFERRSMGDVSVVEKKNKEYEGRRWGNRLDAGLSRNGSTQRIDEALDSDIRRELAPGTYLFRS